jgi:hypothetical protein
MLLSYLQGKDYNEFTKNVEEIYANIEKIEKQFYKLRDNEKVDMLTRVAYFTKTDIIDKLKKNKWDLNKPIYVQRFNGKKSLKFAYEETVGKIIELSKTLKEYFSITNILEDEETHSKWKKTYLHLDDENSIIKRYPTIINFLATGSIAYVRGAGIDYFTIYTRDEKRIVIYTLTEIKDKIKVHIRCEDVSSINEESELVFNINTDQSTIAIRCEELMFDLYERVTDEVIRQKKW